MARSRRATACIVAVVALGTVAACSTTTDGSPVDSTAPGSGAGSASNASNGGGPTLGSVWTSKIDGVAGSDQQLTAGASDGKNAYASDVSGFVFKLAAATGKVLWKVHPGTRSGTGPTYAGGRLFFYDTDQGLFALDPATGRTVWRHRDGVTAADHNTIVPVSKGIAVLPGPEGGLQGLRASTGKTVWTRPGDPRADYAAADARAVYVTSGLGGTTSHLDAISATTGAVLWKHSTPTADNADVTVYAVGGLVLQLVVVAKGDDTTNSLTALDPRTGHRIWSVTSAGIQGDQPPVSAGGVIAFASLKGVLGFDARSGKAVYTVAMDHGPADGVARCGATVCADGLETLVALNPTGKQLSSTKLPDDSISLAPSSSGPLYVIGSGSITRMSR